MNRSPCVATQTASFKKKKSSLDLFFVKTSFCSPPSVFKCWTKCCQIFILIERWRSSTYPTIRRITLILPNSFDVIYENTHSLHTGQTALLNVDHMCWATITCKSYTILMTLKRNFKGSLLHPCDNYCLGFCCWRWGVACGIPSLNCSRINPPSQTKNLVPSNTHTHTHFIHKKVEGQGMHEGAFTTSCASRDRYRTELGPRVKLRIMTKFVISQFKVKILREKTSELINVPHVVLIFFCANSCLIHWTRTRTLNI